MPLTAPPVGILEMVGQETGFGVPEPERAEFLESVRSSVQDAVSSPR